MCDDCKCGCDKPKRFYSQSRLSEYSDERLATAYRSIRDASSKYRDELYARGYTFEIATLSRGFVPVNATRAEFRWRKLVVIEPKEIILT